MAIHSTLELILIFFSGVEFKPRSYVLKDDALTSVQSPRGQIFKAKLAPTEKLAPTQYSAFAIVRAYGKRRREFAPMRVLKNCPWAP
jgi:hypothetical protein